MTADATFTDRLTMEHSDNSLAFQYSAMKFVRPRSTFYRYRIVEQDSTWHVVSADSADNMVDERGQFYLSFVGMQPGTYTIEVMASARSDRWEGGVRRLTLVIRSPWWATAWAIALYMLLTLLVAGGLVWAYIRAMRRKAERNIANPSYSVEQLSRDLCMERTGLYRKLMAAMDKSPVAFIRTIRLARAAELLDKGGHTVAEISELTGFSSPGYFSKCFQQHYGCRPSEFAGRNK